MERQDTEYISATRNWLNERFNLFDADDIYIPNQSAYGFSALAFRLEEYARMYSVLRVLNRISFKNLLDIGSADGYGPAIISDLFNVDAIGLDLSDRAILRGREMFQIKGVAGNAQLLPFAENSFDVSVCTEVLEHVIDPESVVSEMIRVSRKFVLLSTPRASNEQARQKHFRDLDPNEPHAHIHYFTDEEVKSFVGQNALYMGARTRLLNSLLDKLAWGDDTSRNQREAYFNFTKESADLGDLHIMEMRKMLIDRYQVQKKWKKSILNKISVALILRIDAFIAALKSSLALDHLILIPVSSERSLGKKSLSTKYILNQLLGGYRVEPLKRVIK